MKRTIKIFTIFFCLSLSIKAQIKISDTNFEQALIDLKLDTDGLNGSITESDASKIDTLRIWNADNVSTETIIFPNNPFLKNVKAKIKDISAIAHMPNLVYLNAAYNEIEEINVSSNSKLTYLDISDNRIPEIDIKSNRELKVLFAYKNVLTNLNILENDKLEQLSFGEDLMQNIDLSNNKMLKKVSCVNSQIEELNLTHNILLSRLEFFNNSKPTTLNLSKNPKIDTLYVSGNKELTSINLKNGENTKIGVTGFLMTNNSKLACVDVDDPDYSNLNWFIKEPNLTFNKNCRGDNYVYIPDNALKKSIISSNPGLVKVFEDYFEKSSLLNVSTLKLSEEFNDITGLFEIKNITDLTIKDFEYTQDFISKLTELKFLYIFSYGDEKPNLESLNLNENSKLEVLELDNLINLKSVQINFASPLKEFKSTNIFNIVNLTLPTEKLELVTISDNFNLKNLNLKKFLFKKLFLFKINLNSEDIN